MTELSLVSKKSAQESADYAQKKFYTWRGHKLRFFSAEIRAATQFYGSAARWHNWKNQSALADFHALRQGFSPPHHR